MSYYGNHESSDYKSIKTYKTRASGIMPQGRCLSYVAGAANIGRGRGGTNAI